MRRSIIMIVVKTEKRIMKSDRSLKELHDFAEKIGISKDHFTKTGRAKGSDGYYRIPTAHLLGRVLQQSDVKEVDKSYCFLK
jgi:hypothetical protein